ncbi:MAG: murein biosynthesis integral membrane protein MurJ [Planctomycetota bacterium]|nr:murein biosynthesis integral membrane protein MurJ [Planctomycetota bacterium]
MSKPDAAAAAPESVARPATLVSAATVCSRITGLLREAIFAALFAASRMSDAFVFAFRIPNLLRDFFAEGALSSAFVPTFAKAREAEGDERAFQIARRVMGTLGAIALVIVLLGILFAPAIVAVVAHDAPKDLRPLTIKLTRIMFPFLLFVALASVVMGVLNTHRRYFVPALAPMFFNVTAVAGGVVLLVLEQDVITALTAWSVLVVVGGLLQLLIQLPLLFRIGWRGRPEPDLKFRDPALRQIVRRMGPVVISLAGTNVMIVITTALASRADGWASALNYAFRLIHLPIGIVGVALGTVVLTAGARRSAAADEGAVEDIARRGLRLNWFLALPSAVGLFVLAEPLVRLIYERGRFGPEDTRLVTEALMAYAGGVVFYAGVKAGAPLFLARGDTRTPMRCSLLGIAVNLAFALLAIDAYGHRALAFAVALGAATNYLALRLMARRRYGIASAPGWAFLGRVVAASAVMGLAGWGLQAWLLRGDEGVRSAWVQGGLTLLAVVVLAALYFLVSAALGIKEVDWVKRRFGRARKA